MATIESHVYRSWAHFKSEVITDLFGDTRFRSGRYLFRGQGDADWHLQTSFDRWFTTLPVDGDRIMVADELLRNFVQSYQGYIDTSEQLIHDSMRALALARHFGLPTRLLDWSESPYVAAYFAFQHHLSTISARTTNVAVWVLHRTAPIWKREIGVEIVNVPVVGNARLKNQAGLFTMSRTPFETLEEYVLTCPSSAIGLTRLMIPASEASNVLSDLAAMGLTAAHLFPGPEGAVYAAQQAVVLGLLDK